MNDEKHWLQAFVEKNMWSIILLVGGMILIYANTSSRVSANENHIENLQTTVERLTTVVERIVVLEEHDKQIREDLKEVKEDVKTLLKQTK